MDIKRKKLLVQRTERVTSRFVLTFVIYTYLYLIGEILLPEINNIDFLGVKMYIPVYTIVGFCVVGTLIKKNVNLLNFLFNEEFNEEELMTVILRSSGIGMLYFLAQLAGMIYFVPAFADVQMFGASLYLPLFAANSFLVSALYYALYNTKEERRIKQSNPFTDR